jgi:hypothetical protein
MRPKLKRLALQAAFVAALLALGAVLARFTAYLVTAAIYVFDLWLRYLSWLPGWGYAVLAFMVATLIFEYRYRYPFQYGMTECVVGMGSAWTISDAAKGSAPLYLQGLAMMGALYVVVRGLDNMRRADEAKKLPKWARTLDETFPNLWVSILFRDGWPRHRWPDDVPWPPKLKKGERVYKIRGVCPNCSKRREEGQVHQCERIELTPGSGDNEG